MFHTVATKSPVVRRRGRPPKFGRASRAVTITLPEDVLARLAELDADIGRAIVAAVEGTAAPRPRERPPAELAMYGNHAVILVSPIKALRQLSGVELVPIGPNRALIALEAGQPIAGLELGLREALERTTGEAERRALAAVARILRDARMSSQLTVAERTIIVLEYRRRRRAAR
jgi:hypothetical protein